MKKSLIDFFFFFLLSYTTGIYALPPACVADFTGLATGRLPATRAHFQHSRGLSQYWNELGHVFPQSLLALKPGQRWLDAGAGDGKATRQLHEGQFRFLPGLGRARISQILTVTVSLDRLAPSAHENTSVINDAIRDGSHQILEGKTVESLSVEAIGKCDLITDVFGPAAYVRDIARTLNHYFELLAPGGQALIRIGKDTKIRTAQGEFGLLWWIERNLKSRSIEVLDGRVLVLRRPTNGDLPFFPALKCISPNELSFPPSRLYIPVMP